MKQAIIATEIMAVVIQSILLFGTVFESRMGTAKKRSFAALVAVSILAAITDLLTYIPYEVTQAPRFEYAAVLASFLVPPFVYLFFLQYLRVYMKSKAEVSRYPFLIGAGYFLVMISCSLYYGLTGKLFDMSGGVFHVGEYYEGYVMCFMTGLAYILIVILAFSRRMGAHDTFATLLFLAVPAITLSIALYMPDAMFAIASIAVSNLIIVTMLQADHEKTLVEREQVSFQLAHRDDLTGLNNRLAYTEYLESLSGTADLGVVFADLNVLKYTNDHYGHRAGDELLCDFRDLMVSIFRRDEVYRISGDEFVVLLLGIPRAELERRVALLGERIRQSPIPIASFGSAFGGADEAHELIERAERMMYGDKEDFRKRFPAYKR